MYMLESGMAGDVFFESMFHLFIVLKKQKA